jgi:hypothetical protein
VTPPTSTGVVLCRCWVLVLMPLSYNEVPDKYPWSTRAEGAGMTALSSPIHQHEAARDQHYSGRKRRR